MPKRLISLFLCAVMLFSVLPVRTGATDLVTEPVEAVTEPAEETTLLTEAEPEEEMPAPEEDDTEPAEKSSEPEETEPVTIESPMETEPIEENIITEEIPLQESGSTVVKSGTCGTGVTWTLDDEGILTISGSGAMKNYQAGSAPWRYNDPNHVVIEDGVTSIGKYAFYEMDSLESVFVGAGVASIGSKAFSECSNLEQIDVSENNSVYSAIDGVIFSKDQTVLVECPDGKEGRFEIPNGVVEIADSAFASCDLSDIVIPNSVAEIGKYAFNACFSLKKLEIPYGVTEIKSWTFAGCSVEEVVIPGSVTSIASNAFTGAELETLVIPEGVKTIGNFAFEYCSWLKSVELPRSLQTIGSGVFNYCEELRAVTIPQNVTKIGNNPFAECYSLKEIWIECSAVKTYRPFHDVTATVYYPANDPTWTEEAMEMYGEDADLTWVPYIPKDEESRNVQVNVVCYTNQKALELPDENYVLSANVQATIGTETHMADSTGQISLTGKPEDLVTFRQEGYASRTISMEDLIRNNQVRLQKETDAPLIYGLWMGQTDILHEEISFKDSDQAAVTFIPELDWGAGSAGSLSLSQHGKTISLQEGENKIDLKSQMDITEEIYLEAVNAQGETARKLLKIDSLASYNLDGFTFDLGDSLSFTLPESAGILAGQQIDLGLYSPVPVEVTISNGKVYGSIGIQWDATQDSDRNAEVKNAVDEIKKIRNTMSDCAAGIKEYKQVQDAMKNLNYPAAKLPGSCGVSGSWTLLGFVEGYLDQDKNFVLSNAGGILAFGASLDYHQPFVVGPVPMFFELSFSGDIESQFNLYIQQKIKQFTPQIELEGILALKGGLGVGVADALSFSGGLKGSLINTLQYDMGHLDYYRLKAALDWYVKLQVLFMSFEDGDTIKDAVWYEYPSPVMTLGLDDGEPEANRGRPDYYDMSNYTMDDLSYLCNGSGFIDGASTFARRNAAGVPFVSNAYEGADPQAVTFSDGSRLTVWIGYNDSYSGADALNLYYSYYDGTWSQPQLVEQDGTTDAYPDLKVINDTAYLVWQDASSSIGSNPTLDSMASLMGISGAVFDKEAASFVCHPVISGGGVLNMQPKLCGDSSAVYAVWQRNDENDWFGQNSSNSLLYSCFSGDDWSAPAVLYSGLNPLMDFDVICSGGSCIVAYSMDGDGDLNTTEDIEVYKNGIVLTENDWLDSGVTFSGTDLYWYSGGKLVKNGDEAMPEGVFISSDRFQIVNEHGVHALVYAEEDGLASVLKAAYYDVSSGGWGTPKTLYSAGTSISAFSASATADGEISVLIQKQEVTGAFDGSDPYGTVNLVWYNAPMGCDLRLDDVRHDNENYIANSDMPVYITVSNAGELAVNGLLVEWTDAEGTVLQTETIEEYLLSGESREIEVFYHVADVGAGMTLSLKVTPEDMEDVFPEDNTSEMILGWEDLSVEDVRAGVTASGEIIIHANIVNRGYAVQNDVAVKLLEMTPSGPVVETITLESIEAQSGEPVSFTLGNLVSKVYYVCIDHRETDQNAANDSAFVNVTAYIEPDSIYGENAVLIHESEITEKCTVSVDGLEVNLKKFGEYYYSNLIDHNANIMTVHTYGTMDGKEYPVSMKVWTLENDNGFYTATRQEEFDDILQYAGSSIRVTGKKGIRMITAIDQEKKKDLITDGLAGYTLKEYGTVIAWASQINADKPLVLGKSYVKSNYAYKQGVADPIFAYKDGKMQYTNVLVNFSDEQCKKDIAMRPYMILTDGENDITLYGGIVERSIGYIAAQNAYTYNPEKQEEVEAYNYIWNIIKYVYGEDYVPENA